MTTAIIRTAAILVALAALPGAVSAQTGMTREQVQRRYQVRVMEGVLVGAAQHGAELLALRVQQIDPSIVLFTGTVPRAQGLVLEGHGVVFYLEVPGINPAIVWAMRNRGRDQAAETAVLSLRRHLSTLPDVQQRSDLELYLRRLEQRVLPPGAATPTSMTPGMAPSPTAAPMPAMDDPDGEYEQAVVLQIVNAMLDFSHQLGLGADEWLTIAARGSQTAGDSANLVTITLRIKGSDLADLRTGRITRDEARARVVVREF
ncbi:MAG: hypothetical protein M3R55_06565 [Acidobacteriota bacterium]|nr:hypothetical protein [Acidobacteriota bacterium]